MDIIINLANSGEYKHLYNAIRELEDENLLTDFSVRTIDKNFQNRGDKNGYRKTIDGAATPTPGRKSGFTKWVKANKIQKQSNC